MTFFLVLACIGGYFGAGTFIAVMDLPDLWRRAMKRWDYEDIARESVWLTFLATVAFWPVFIPARWVVNGHLRPLIEAAREEAQIRRDLARRP